MWSPSHLKVAIQNFFPSCRSGLPEQHGLKVLNFVLFFNQCHSHSHLGVYCSIFQAESLHIIHTVPSTGGPHCFQVDTVVAWTQTNKKVNTLEDVGDCCDFSVECNPKKINPLSLFHFLWILQQEGKKPKQIKKLISIKNADYKWTWVTVTADALFLVNSQSVLILSSSLSVIFTGNLHLTCSSPSDTI